MKPRNICIIYLHRNSENKKVMKQDFFSYSAAFLNGTVCLYLCIKRTILKLQNKIVLFEMCGYIVKGMQVHNQNAEKLGTSKGDYWIKQ